jgi:hypothetical protein
VLENQRLHQAGLEDVKQQFATMAGAAHGVGQLQDSSSSSSSKQADSKLHQPAQNRPVEVRAVHRYHDTC